MKKSTSQVFVAIVCGLLGFLLAYQFKMLAKQGKQENSYKNTDIISEIESLKKEKDELFKSNTALTEDLKKLEESASKEGNVGTEIVNQLNTVRMQLGLVDVKGPGVILTIKPRTDLFSSGISESNRKIGEEEIIHLVNALWFAKAEAVSVDEMRVTPQTGIKESNKWISIGSEGRVDPDKTIVIKAIGDKVRLYVGATFQDTQKFGVLGDYTIETVQSDDVVIKKTAQSLRSDYISPVKE